MRTARQHSPRLKAARYEAQAAQAQAERNRPVARPSVTAQATGTIQGPRVTFPRAGGGDALILPEEYGRLELSVEQTLYRPGIGAARERYGAQTRANRWERLRAESDVDLDVRRAFFQLATARLMADVAHSGVDLTGKRLQLTRDMLRAGTASERDVKVAEADVAEAEQGAIVAENGAALAAANLNRVMGRDPGAALPIIAPGPLPHIPDSPDAGIRRALERRPEIRQLEENLRAARAGAILAGTQDKPALSLRATAAAQTPSAFVRSEYFAASLVLNWNPFDRGRTRADVMEARAQAGRLEALLEETRLGIRVEVQTAWRGMRDAQARVAAAARQVEASRAALEVSTVRFEARAATQLEVSSALQNLARAKANHAQALNDLRIAGAEFIHATAAEVYPDAADGTP